MNILSYYETEIIANRCSDYKGLLESVIDAIVLNGVFPCDIATDSLLFNIEVASVPSECQIYDSSWIFPY